MNKTALPNLIIIGAQKCATTSLHYYLNLHPEISMSRTKEPNFFIVEGNWYKGGEWYKAQFDPEAKVRGEASPVYTAYPLYDGVPQRMSTIAPNAKLIYILRDPIERIISHYVHRKAIDFETRTIEEALENCDRHNEYIIRSKYFNQLEQYFPFFPKAQIYVLTAEDLEMKRKATMKAIFRFLDVNDTYWSKRFYLMWHRSKFKRKMPNGDYPIAGSLVRAFVERLPFELKGLATQLLWLPFSQKVERPGLNTRIRKLLTAEFARDVEKLRDYTGQSFEKWSV